MTTRLNRIISLGGAAALVAVTAFSAGTRAETKTQQPSLVTVAAADGFGALCFHRYPNQRSDPSAGQQFPV